MGNPQVRAPRAVVDELSHCLALVTLIHALESRGVRCTIDGKVTRPLTYLVEGLEHVAEKMRIAVIEASQAKRGAQSPPSSGDAL